MNADLLRDLKDPQLAPNDSEVKTQEVRTNLEGLFSKIDALETGFADLVERSRTVVRQFLPFHLDDQFFAVLEPSKPAGSDAGSPRGCS
jgi:hypothetical protein